MLPDERDHSADRRRTRQQHRQEADFASLLDSLAERHAFAPEAVREIDQQDGVLDLDSDEGNETDHGDERQGVLCDVERNEAAHDPEGYHECHNGHLCEASELEQQDGQHAKQGNKHGCAKARKAFVCCLGLATKGDAVAGRQIYGLEAFGNILRYVCGKIIRQDIRQDGVDAFLLYPVYNGRTGSKFD